MKYYRTAVLTSWLIVGGAFSALALINTNGAAYRIIPIYLAYVIVGGTVPALICAWALRNLCRISGFNRFWHWMLYGGYIGIAYSLISNSMMTRIIGHASMGSVKGFLCLAFFGPAILLKMGLVGLSIIFLAGEVSGAILYHVNRRDKSP